MMGDRFHQPDAWPLLLLAAALAGLLWWRDRRREALLHQQCGDRALALSGLLDRGRRRGRRHLAGWGCLLATVAILQPVGGPSPDQLLQEGSDVVFCLDVSRSMLARDQLPDRLDAARQHIRQWALGHGEGRLGLVLFAGEARLAVPLTRDRQSFLALLEEAAPESIARGGTDLGAAIEEAARCVPAAGNQPATLVLLTDGEDHQGRGREAAERLAAKELRLHAVGYGTPQGGKIPVPGLAGESYLQDRSGNEVLSVMDPASLQALAAASGGEFLFSAAVPEPLEDLYDRGRLTGVRRAVAGEGTPRRGNRYQWPLLAAVLLWAWELAWSDRRNP